MEIEIKITKKKTSWKTYNTKFSSTKTMSQYIRRNQLEAQVFINKKHCILIGNHYIAIEDLEKWIETAKKSL